MTTHLVIPDTQIKPGSNVDHLVACGNLIMDRRPDVIVHLGDHWDFPSLNTHTSAAKIHYEHRSYIEDLKAGMYAMETLLKPMELYNKRRALSKKSMYRPKMIFTTGNHEYRVDRLLDQEPILKGAIPSFEDYLYDKGFKVYPYKQKVQIDGVNYCHLCPQTRSAGAVERAHLIMQKRNSSWTVGHSQILDYYVSPHKPRLQCIIAGAFYTHDEDYKVGSNDHWRGIIFKNNVVNGSYDPEFMSIDGLIKGYGS